MNSTQLRLFERTRPFVAVVCAVPLLGEAMRSAFDFAHALFFSTSGGNIGDRPLDPLRPDALIGGNAGVLIARDGVAR